MKYRKSRIPYGYRIRDGKAVIEPQEAERLKCYFQYYLDGETMAEAARMAGLTCSKGTYPNLFRRPEYVGDAYYPGLIEPAYQKLLVREWERRRAASPRVRREPVRQEVKVYTDFRFAGKMSSRGGEKSPAKDAAGLAEELFGQIQPCG